MKTLLVGYRAADLTPELLEGDVTCHTLDIYHRHAIEKTWHAKAVCAPHLPEGPWDRVCFRTGPKLTSGELELDLFQECLRVAPNREIALAGSVPAKKSPGVVLDYVGRERDRNDLLAKVRDRTDRCFKSTWRASVPGGEPLTFVSYPGCFCHRRLDEGGLALAEVVTREMTNEELRMKAVAKPPCPVDAFVSNASDKEGNPPFDAIETIASTGFATASMKNGGAINLLDMGCGCGLVGLLIADRLKRSFQDCTIPSGGTRSVASADGTEAVPPEDGTEAVASADGTEAVPPEDGTEAIPPEDGTEAVPPEVVKLTMVDSHSRAVEAATENAAALGVPAEVILSDNGTPARLDGTFDVFVGNPPYYSDYRIADVFLETAKRALRPGGVCYTVCKNAAGLEPVQRKYFPDVTLIRRRGYAVLKSRKPQTAEGGAA